MKETKKESNEEKEARKINKIGIFRFAFLNLVRGYGGTSMYRADLAIE